MTKSLDLADISKKIQKTGFQSRESQLAMIESIYDALKNKKIIGIEAPTGTGKTLAYTIGSFLAKASDQTVIISTATIALQEQLVNKDLPIVEKVLGKKIKLALAKGRRRYVCHARVYDPMWQDDLLSETTTEQLLQVELEQKNWNGDRDELKIHVDDQQWRQVSTDADGCAGKLCAYYEDCAFVKARKRVYVADVVVVNHSLLLSDMSMGGGAILPEPDESIYVIDECHHLPGKSADHFSASASVMGVTDWSKALSKVLVQARGLKLVTDDKQKQILDLTDDLKDVATQVRDYLSLNTNQFDDGVWRITDLPDEILLLGKEIARIADVLVTYGNEITDAIFPKGSEPMAEKDKDERGRVLAGLGFAISRATNQCQTWRMFCHQRQGKEAPVAKWFEQRDNAFIVHAAPIYVGDVLKKQLWDKFVNGAVLCSATMSALGSFDYFCRKTGLKGNEDYIKQSIPSMFDFQKSLLYVPKMTHEPSGFNQQKHLDETLQLLPELIDDKAGTLVLFTSRRAMEQTYEQLPKAIRSDVLMQKSQNKSQLIEKHKKRIRSWKRSILFGLVSFGEGLDLPADFCRHVIIHKLPFSVPNTPIEQTRSDWLKANKLNSFMMATLPQASIQLTQFVGRLIRQEDDYGVVTILDKRLYSKQYGALLLKNLPDFQRLIDVDLADFKQKKQALQAVEV
ncbi:MAG: ATP-dependent DNA helicase DinG [Coxiellaceae bacterium]|nr:ATP-dependent DNA helicase DinG [Coxiellaceae bacterium]